MTTRALGPLCGLLFALTYLGAFALMDLPEGSYTDAEVVALFTGTARTQTVVGGVLLAVGAIALIPFIVALRERVSGRGADVGAAAGLVYVAIVLVVAGLQTGYFTSVAIGEIPQPVDPTVARVMTGTGFALLLLPGLWCAAVWVLATSLAARRTRSLDRGLVRAGFVVAPLLLAGVAYAPQLLVPLWVLAVAAAQLRRGAAAAGPAPATELHDARAAA